MPHPQLFMPDSVQPAVYTLPEASQYLHLPKSTLYSLAQNGKVPALKASRFWMFPKADLDAWMSKEAKRRMGR